MTTIAWDGKSLSSDSQSTTGSLVTSLTEKKIYRAGIDWQICGEKVTALGLAGDCGANIDVIAALKSDLNTKSKFSPAYDFTALVVTQRKSCFLIFKEKDKELPLICEQVQPYAIGSGADIARAAMHMGKSAAESVHIAIELDIYSGGDVVTIEV